MSQQELQQIKGQLDQLKAQLGAAQIRRGEIMGTLRDTYGINTAKAAVTEHKKLITKTIPTLEHSRDGYVQKAQEVLNGLTQKDPTIENNQRGGNQPGGLTGNSRTGGPAQSRTPVGLKR